MYIYNVTINIDESVHDQWIDWMNNTHIPDMLATGKFTEAKMSKVLVVEEMGGTSYSIQYTTPDMETLERYYEEDAERLRKEGIDLFDGKFVAFRTVLEVVNEQKAELPGAIEYLFTYGTLQDEMIQKVVLSRSLNGKADSLPGYCISKEKVAGAYPVVEKSKNPADRVEGVVYLISDKELLKTDAYEGVAYMRSKVILESGIESWVYLRSTSEYFSRP